MRHTLGQRLRYRFENFMSRGWVSVFISLLVLFFAFLILVVAIRVAVLTVSPEFEGDLDSWGKHFWVLLQEYTSSDVLELVADHSLGLKLSALFTLLVGMVFFSMLIAFINTRMEKVIFNFRKGRSPVMERGHSLVLGWNSRIFDLFDELIIANRSRSSPAIVVLAERDKEKMDDEIWRSVTDTGNTKIVTRTGSPTSIGDLKRVNAAEARSAIVLSRAAETDPDERLRMSDTMALKTILALQAIRGKARRMSIVSEVFTGQKRDIIRSFDSDRLNCINSWRVLGKIMVQTSRSHGTSSGLAVVYEEIFSYQGSEIYFFGGGWDSLPFHELYRYLDDGVPFGIRHRDGGITLRPPRGTALGPGEDAIVLATDDSRLELRPEPLAAFPELEGTGERLEKRVERELLLGWSPSLPVLVHEYSDYLIEGSRIDIMLSEPSGQAVALVNRLRGEHPHLEIDLISSSPLDQAALASVDPFAYDNVIILAQSETPVSPEEIDADTLVILLLLRRLRRELPEGRRRAQIITQVMKAENEDLVASSEADDFIVSNRMITMLLAQLSEQPGIAGIYEELFSEAGSEIYLKPARLYFRDLPREVPFGSMIEAAAGRDEICIGFREMKACADSRRNYGITLNPGKRRVFHVDADDTLVVIAEGES
ncbi:MAG: hypothetical protein R6U36_06095 [Candidatus Fermentibacteraceae bacterium]